MAAITDPNQASSILASDPEFQRLAAQAKAKTVPGGHGAQAGAEVAAMRQRAAQLGIDVQGMHVGNSLSTFGDLSQDKSVMEKYWPLIAMGAIAGGAALAPAIGGGSAATGGATAATTGATTAGTAALPTAAAATTAAGAGAGTGAGVAAGIGAGTKLGLGLAGLGLDAVTTFYGLKTQANNAKANQALGQAQIASNEKIAGMNSQQAAAQLAAQEREHTADNSLTREQFQLNAQLAREAAAQQLQILAQKRADLAPFLNALAAGLMPKGSSSPGLPPTNGAPAGAGAPPADPTGNGTAAMPDAPNGGVGTPSAPTPPTSMPASALNATTLAATQGKKALSLADLGA